MSLSVSISLRPLQLAIDILKLHQDAAANKHINSVEAIVRGLAKHTGPKPGKKKQSLFFK